jgi:hypothetical protein
MYSTVTEATAISWTSSSSGNSLLGTNAGSVCWNGTYFIAGGVGTSFSMIYSRNGITWTGINKTTFTSSAYGLTSRRVLPFVGLNIEPSTSANAADISVTELSVSTISQTLDTSNWNRYFYIITSAFTTITLLSSTTATTQGGKFWSLRNQTSTYLSLTVTNNLNLPSTIVIPPNNSVTIVISAATNSTYLLF